jgi:hypothetical protein
MDADSDAGEQLIALNRFFIRSLLALGKTGEDERDQACRIAAPAWSKLRHTHPREAERLNGVMHSLTQSTHPISATKER